MSENVVTLPGKRPAWMATLSDHVGPVECRAFAFLWIPTEGPPNWIWSGADEVEGLAMCELLRMMADYLGAAD